MATTRTCDFCGVPIFDNTGTERDILLEILVTRRGKHGTQLARDACGNCGDLLIQLLRCSIKDLTLATNGTSVIADVKADVKARTT